MNTGAVPSDTVAVETAEELSTVLSEASTVFADTTVLVVKTVPLGTGTDQVPSAPTVVVAVVITPLVVKETVRVVPASAVPDTEVLTVEIVSLITGAFGVTLSISKVSVKSRRFISLGKVLKGVT
ncbi:hypothetical protein [Streptococcus suis]|uniref:hypothetical protein n=1 Tax=Streptococcus suis TaxID=1307 RepID=UPI002B1E1AD0|nr:hypothetical protein [Streptococcus suis]